MRKSLFITGLVTAVLLCVSPAVSAASVDGGSAKTSALPCEVGWNCW